MPGGQHEIVTGDPLQHRRRLRQHGPAVIDHRHGRDLDPLLAQLELELDPHRNPGAGRDPVSRSWDSLTESTVGSHTVRAPSRAATSTARAFIPPTARLSTIAPSAWMPGTAARTTLARSAVEV